jgi:hypothetical protein
MQCRADLHVHSKFSDRPSEWLLRRIGAPESFMEPIEVYRRAKARGMDYVTISDHNKIHGALEIAHLPGTFISCEVTTYFPEDGAKFHFLVWGIDEAQFKVINEIRTNIYELRDYVVQQNIPHAVAHPLFRVTERTSPDHIEKLLVMFNRFEGINGTRDPRAADLVNVIFRNLTEAHITRLADKHDIAPLGPAPWKKTFTGGSDDHGGAYIASAYTMTPYAATVDQYLDHLRAGHHEMGGSSGNSLMLAHSFYHIGYSYYKDRIMSGSRAKVDLVGEMLRKLVEPNNGHNAPATMRQKVRNLAGRFVIARQFSDAERMLIEEFSQLFEEGFDPHDGDYAAAFEASCRICHQLSWSFVSKVTAAARVGNMLDALQSIAALGPVALSFAPYLAAFSTQHKDELFIRETAARFDCARTMVDRSRKQAWVTDALGEVCAAGRVIDRLAHAEVGNGRDVQVLTCQDAAPKTDLPVINFQPIGEFSIQADHERSLVFPPFLQIIAYLEEHRFAELVIATPGPMGLTALAAARLLGLRSIAVYQPEYACSVGLTNDEGDLDGLGCKYLAWLADQCDQVLVSSQADRLALLDAGLDLDKIIMVDNAQADAAGPLLDQPAERVAEASGV